MAQSTVENRQKRHKLLEDARGLLDKAEEEKRELSAEEDGQYQLMRTDAASLLVDIEKQEERNRLEAEIKENERSLSETTEGKEGRKGKPNEDGEKTALKLAFQNYLRSGHKGMDPQEYRDLSAGTATEGGYLYPGEQFVDELIQAVTDVTITRQIARGFAIPGKDSLGAPTLDTRMGAAVWGSELGIPSRDADLAFGKRELTPHPMAREIPVSQTLLRNAPNVESLVISELARVGAELEENAFMTGDGAQKPLGMFTASSDGIPTSRDVSTGNTTTSPTFDGLKSAKYEMKQIYWPNLKWLFHRDTMELIAKLKDGEGRYLLQDSVTEGEPDRLIGFPIMLNEFVPSTATTGLYVGMLADFNHYWIVDSIDIDINRLDELLARSNKALFIMRGGVDGAPVLSEAFVRVKLA